MLISPFGEKQAFLELGEAQVAAAVGVQLGHYGSDALRSLLSEEFPGVVVDLLRQCEEGRLTNVNIAVSVGIESFKNGVEFLVIDLLALILEESDDLRPADVVIFIGVHLFKE